MTGCRLIDSLSGWTPLRSMGRLAAALILAAGLGCHIQPKLQVDAQDTAMAVKKKVPLVGSVSYSPDGRFVASGGSDKVVHVWDMVAMKEIRRFKGHTGFIKGVGFLADGRTVTSTSNDGTLRLWDLATGAETRAVPKFLDGILGLTMGVPVTADGRYGLGITSSMFSDSWTQDLHDLRTGQVLQRYPGKFGALAPDGKTILVMDKQVRLVERESGRVLWQAAIGGERAPIWALAAFSPDGTRIAAMHQTMAGPTAPRETTFYLLDARTGQQLKAFGRHQTPGGLISMDKILAQINALAFSPDGRYLLSGDLKASYKLWDIEADRMVCQMKVADELAGNMLNNVPSVAFAPDGRTLVAATLGAARYFDAATGAELASMIAFEDGEWLFMTPSGYYNASEKGDQYLNVSVKGQPYSIAQLRESFFRPDLVKLALSGGSLTGYRKVADLRPPPLVAIVDTPAAVATQEATVTLRITDAGGGIGDVRLYLNGSAVVLEHNRGVAVQAQAGAAALLRQYPVKLSGGANTIRVIAFNDDNSMQSADAVHAITSSYRAAARPSLHALVIGINEYRNPKLKLEFAVADADLFAQTLRDTSGALFDRIEVQLLTSPGETTRESIVRALRGMQSLNPDDLFVFYVASHGTVDDGEYFLITSDVGSTSTARLKTDALSQNLVKELIANIPATKKLIVIDTCGAGKLGDAIQVAMMTRGMSEDTAIKVLSRAVGSTVLAASTSVQEALEGYQGHGLFTHVITEGMKGKADSDGDGFIKTTELANYVDDEVPRLAEKVFNRAQYPTVSPSGMGFPISKVR